MPPGAGPRPSEPWGYGATSDAHHGTAPTAKELRRPDPAPGPLDLVRTARKLSTRARTGELVGLVGLSTSFRFGGHDAALVLAAEGRS
ncbi:hypothetical protein [Streptomyces sp. NPDC004285]